MNTLQIDLQGGLELEQIVTGQLQSRGGSGGHGGISWIASDPGNLPHDFSLQ